MRKDMIIRMTTAISGEQSGISSGVLKIIAIITMLIDHLAAAVLVRYIYVTGDVGPEPIYYAMRQIGRIAFPIYCFLLVEGVSRTHHKGKYLLRMLLLAIISEIPFDLAFSSQVLEFNYQNVFFTLTIALAAMIGLEWIAGKIESFVLQRILIVLVTFASMAVAYLIQSDYNCGGVACILIMYFLRYNRKAQLIAGYVAFVLILKELMALPAFVALAFYRGKKGFSNKFFFYGFYPLHLLVLYVVCVFMGIDHIPAI